LLVVTNLGTGRPVRRKIAFEGNVSSRKRPTSITGRAKKNSNGLRWHSLFEHSFRVRKGALASPSRITGLWKGATSPPSTEMLSTFDPTRPPLWVSKGLEKLASAVDAALRPQICVLERTQTYTAARRNELSESTTPNIPCSAFICHCHNRGCFSMVPDKTGIRHRRRPPFDSGSPWPWQPRRPIF